MSYTYLLASGEESSAESFAGIVQCAPWKSNHTQEPCYSSGNVMESSRPSRFGMTCEPSTGIRGEESWTLFAEDFLAKTYHRPIRMPKGLKVSGAGYGEKCGESLATFDPLLSSWKTRQCLLFGDSQESLETWPEWGMTRNGECYAATMPECLNAAPVCGLSPVPHAEVPKEYTIKTPSMLRAINRDWMQEAETMPTLTIKIRERAPCPYWRTPTGARYLTEGEAEALMDWPIGWGAKKPLATDRFRSWLRSHGGYSPTND